MTTFTVQVTKPDPTSKLGITFAEEHGKIVLTKMAEHSLFQGTALAVGHEILAVNETRVSGMNVQAVLSILQSIPKVVTIEAYTSALFHLTYEERKVKTSDGQGGVYVKTKFEVTSDAAHVPALLAKQSVTKAQWAPIVNAYSQKLLPVMYQSNQMDKQLMSVMENFVGSQMGGGVIGFGAESRHERKVFLMTHQSSVLSDNCNLLATNLVVQANALLNSKGILAQLTFSSTKLPKWSPKGQQENNVVLRPNGLTFVSLTD